MKSLKLKDHLGGNITDCCDAILVYAKRLKSSGAFNPEHLGYIIHVFEDTSDYRFLLWKTHNYKEGIEVIKRIFVSDYEFMRSDDIITYGSLL